VSITARSDARIQGIIRFAKRRVSSALATHSIDLLRVSLGIVFLAFGVLKFFPGLSPAEGLVVRTIDLLSLGIVPAPAALVLVALLETFIGLAFVTGRWVIAGLVALGVASIGFFAPLVLFAGELFGSGPTIEAQYIVKDAVLVTAALVVAAKALGARMAVDTRG
jgi:putative oxidoreductase